MARRDARRLGHAGMDAEEITNGNGRQGNGLCKQESDG